MVHFGSFHDVHSSSNHQGRITEVLRYSLRFHPPTQFHSFHQNWNYPPNQDAIVTVTTRIMIPFLVISGWIPNKPSFVTVTCAGG